VFGFLIKITRWIHSVKICSTYVRVTAYGAQLRPNPYGILPWSARFTYSWRKRKLVGLVRRARALDTDSPRGDINNSAASRIDFAGGRSRRSRYPFFVNAKWTHHHPSTVSTSLATSLGLAFIINVIKVKAIVITYTTRSITDNQPSHVVVTSCSFGFPTRSRLRGATYVLSRSITASSFSFLLLADDNWHCGCTRGKKLVRK
jgi:hypothetical protein